MKKFFSAQRTTAISLLLGALLVGFLFLYIDPREVGREFMTLAWWKFALLVVVSSAMFIVTSLRWNIILRSLNIKLSFRKVFLSRLAGFAVSYSTPVAEFGGAPARAYLIKDKKISLKKALSSAILDNLLEFVIQVFFISATLLYIIAYFSLPPRVDYIVAAICAMMLLIVSFIYLRFTKGESIVEKIFTLLDKTGLDKYDIFCQFKKTIKEGEKTMLDFFVYHKPSLYKSLGAGIAAYLLSAMEIWVLSLLMGLDLTLLQVLIIKAIFSIAYTFPVPAALGVTEWSQAGYFATIGAGGGLGVVFSLTFKAKNLVFVIIGAFYLAYRGLLNFAKIPQGS